MEANNTTQDTPAVKRVFETETCSRCAGSGSYSYCQMYGTTCFKCRGKGKTYTKRAEAALAWAKEQRMVKVSDVQVGWLYYESAGPFGNKVGWFPVQSVGQSRHQWIDNATGEAHYYWDIITEQMSHGTFANEMVQVVPSKERLREIRDAALDYQDQLTKAGTLRKKRAA